MQPPNPLDLLTYIAIILLVLSLITEKITQLLRKWVHHWGCKALGLEVQEKTDEVKGRNALLLSVGVGTFVAGWANANIFLLIKSDTPKADLFQPVSWDLTNLLGLLLTGFFLSFGSKFFHDLLDVLLQVKNLKRKLNDERTYQVETIKEFDEFIELRDGDIARKAVKQNQARLMKEENVSSILVGNVRKDGKLVKGVVVHIQDKKQDKIPKQLSVTLPSGRDVVVPVEVIENIQIPEIHLGIGSRIKNGAGGSEGTYGCVLQDEENQEFILTCGHVLSNGRRKISPREFPSDDPDVQIGRSGARGSWHYGMINKRLDIALIDPNEEDIVNKNKINGRKLGEAREVGDEDWVFRTPVTLEGAKNGSVKGVVVNTESCTKMRYKDDVVELQNLIVIASRPGGVRRTLTQGGDSGAVIYDEKKRALGMIVGGNSEYSFAMPMVDILDHLDMEIA